MCPVVHLWHTEYTCFGILCKIRVKYWEKWQTDVTLFGLHGWFWGGSPTLYVEKYIRNYHLNRGKVWASEWRLVRTWRATHTGKWNMHDWLVRQCGERIPWYRWGYNVGMCQRSRVQMYSLDIKYSRYTKMMGFCKYVRFFTAMSLKIEGFAVELACQQHVFNLHWIFCLHKLWTVKGRSFGDRGSTAVKVLCYKSEGCWFDPS